MSENRGMTIGQVAKQTGLSTQAIRYYEREGLLPKPGRTHTSYRIYEPETLGRLNFIRTARALGFSLDEIKEIFRMSRAGRAPCCRVRELLTGKFDELDRKIEELSRFREEACQSRAREGNNANHKTAAIPQALHLPSFSRRRQEFIGGFGPPTP